MAKEKYLPDIQEMVPENRNVIIMASRQVGKTTTIAAFFSWYLCFHNDRNLAILANKQATAFEIVSKVIDVFKGLPFFLKPGMISGGSGFMRLDNGCSLMSQAITKTAQIGFTIHVLYADEFAHIMPNIAKDFWRSVYPTLASSEISQCIITSTPSGQENIFFEIWSKAENDKNSFLPIRVDFWEVPGHDEEWAKKMRADFGEEAFAQEFELDFTIGDSNLLLGANDLAFIKKIERPYEFKELANSQLDETLYRNLKWDSEFDPNVKYDQKTTRFVISIDTGEGKNEEEIKDNDYNVCNIFKVEQVSLSYLKRLRNDEFHIKNMFRLTQVGLYRDNIKDEENCANVTKTIIFDHLGAEICKLLIEMNFNGKYFLDKFKSNDNFYDDLILYTHHTKPIPGEKPPRRKAGFRVGQDKDFFCKIGKKMISKKILVVNEKETAKEFRAFGRDKRGKYKGIGVHDDIAMSVLNLSRLYNETSYEDWLYDFFDAMEDSPVKKLMSELLDKYVESTDVNDEEFETMYKDKPEIFTESHIMDIINHQNLRYPGMPPSNKLGWKKS
jgi:hypothetical protein